MSIVTETLPELRSHADHWRVRAMDQLLRSGHYRRGVFMRDCFDRLVGGVILEENGRDRKTLEEEKQAAIENHDGWHRFQGPIQRVPCVPSFSAVIYAPSFPRKAERGYFENYSAAGRWWFEIPEAREFFPLSDQARDAALKLEPPVYRKGRLVAGNASIELIGSSPMGNVLYTSPGVTETWTQLPRLQGQIETDDRVVIRRGFAESMYTQLIEGVPGLILGERNEKVLGDLDSITDEKIAEVERDFTTIFGHQLTDFDEGERILRKYRITEPFAAGLYHFLDGGFGQPFESVMIKEHGFPAAAVKGQVTGVVSFGIRVVDKDSLKPIIHHKNYDTVAKALMLKAYWMKEFIAHFTGNPNIRMNADEPFLVEAWNQALGIQEEKIIRLLRTQQAVLGENGGVHCCGITNYRALFESGAKVVELDLTGEEFDGSWESANYAQKFVGVAKVDGLQRFLDQGGQLGLGIVSFDKKISVQQTIELGKKVLKELQARGINIDKRQIMITPVCGAGSVNDVEDAQAGFNNLPQVALRLQEELL